MPELSMAQLTYGAAIMGVVWWLLGWVGKHVLDATALPLIRDRFAKRSKRKALQRAEWLLGDYQHEHAAIYDIRFLQLAIEERQSVEIALAGSVSGAAVLLAWWTAQAAELQAQPLVVVTFAVGLFSFLALQTALAAKRREREMLNLRHPERRRDEVVKRLRDLLVSAKLSEDEVAKWLERVPALSADPKAAKPTSAPTPAAVVSVKRAADGLVKAQDRKTTTTVGEPVPQGKPPGRMPTVDEVLNRLGPLNALHQSSLVELGRTQTDPLLGRTNALYNPVALPTKKD